LHRYNAGVPVVTMRGGCHAHNVGASLLTAVGLTECITRSEDEYVAACVRMAAGPARVAALRGGLRACVLASPLCDGAPFMRGVEDAFVGMFRKWCEDNDGTHQSVKVEVGRCTLNQVDPKPITYSLSNP
jgi:protein O-GlcNAc transferase